MPESGPTDDWFVESHPYRDPDSGEVSTMYEVMCPTPETWPGGQPWRGTGCWGDAYRVACYGDKSAAEEHARTHQKPRGWG